MNTKRSFLDNLNAGRQRKPGNSLEEINRTLDQLESRLERALGQQQVRQERGMRPEGESDIARRIEQLSQRASGNPVPASKAAVSHTPAVHKETGPREEMERIARAIDGAQQQEDHLASIGGIASELKTLRDDMRAAMSAGMRDEFEALREELAAVIAAVPSSPTNDDLNTELERLSNAIGLLAERADDKNTKMLRLELEQVKACLENLAREETVLSLEERWGTLAQRGSSPALERLATRLEEISTTVTSLPESLSLQSMEERLRTLAVALDQFARQANEDKQDLYALIEERLDEISRAVTASAALAHSPSFDASHLERIEARIASLASQIDELVRDRPDGMVVERLAALSERVDEMARRMDAPSQTMERMTTLITQIAEKLDSSPYHQQADELFRSLEGRFAHLSEAMERRQEDAIQQGQTVFQDIERRLEELAERLDRASVEEGASIVATIDERFAELAARLDNSEKNADDGRAVRALEARLDDISKRLQDSVSANIGIDPAVIRNLEAQVASLAAHLAQPGREHPEFQDLSPRLENLERSIGENRAAVLDIARKAAEEATGRLAATHDGTVDDGLRVELANLQALTKKSDERNAKTFEAIHDTLLKIVDRLSFLETGVAGQTDAAQSDPASDKISVGMTPALDVGYSFDDAEDQVEELGQSHGAAALSHGTNPPVDAGEKGRGLRRFSRSLGRRDHAAGVPERREPTLADEAGEAALEVDPARLNEPLEPGSGAPDLNAILRRVRGEGDTHGSAEQEAAKADFIAAARRAAQAAAADARATKEKHNEAEESRRSGVGRILSRRKLLLTVGAAIIIAGGVHFGGTLLQDAGLPTALFQTNEAVEHPSPVARAENQPVTASASAKQVNDQTGAGRVDERAANAAPPPANEGRAIHQQASATSNPSPAPANPQARVASASSQPPSGGDVRKTGSVDSPKAMPAQPQIASAEEAKSQPPRQFALWDIPEDAGPLPLRQAAANGNPAAFYEIGNRYADGRGLKADMAEAAKWYTYAAEEGLAPAQYRIGNLYEKGMGVERDLVKARSWYERAAERGNAGAMHNLGVLLAMGTDGPADSEAAARWFIKAAEFGVPDSQFNLGILSVKGSGLPQDLTEAYKWFDIVAKSGDTDAAKKRDEIAKTLAPADLAKAQGKAKLWNPREPDPAANRVDVPAEWTDGEDITAGVDMKRAITNIQAILDQNGFDPGPPDGVMGERTRAAIRAFQRENGLAETGDINDELVRALLETNKAAR